MRWWGGLGSLQVVQTLLKGLKLKGDNILGGPVLHGPCPPLEKRSTSLRELLHLNCAKKKWMRSENLHVRWKIIVVFTPKAAVLCATKFSGLDPTYLLVDLWKVPWKKNVSRGTFQYQHDRWISICQDRSRCVYSTWLVFQIRKILITTEVFAR